MSIKIVAKPVPTEHAGHFKRGQVVKREVNGFAKIHKSVFKAHETRAPYHVKVQHISGGVCVACNRVLELPAMMRKGYASGVELGLCSGCAFYVKPKQRRTEEVDVDDIESITDDEELQAVNELGLGSFYSYSE